MSPEEIRGPDLAGVVADANAVGLPYVVIGGFAVIAHGYFRATKDSDLLVPDGPEVDEAILRFFERIGATRFNDGKAYTAEEITDAHHLRVGPSRVSRRPVYVASVSCSMTLSGRGLGCSPAARRNEPVGREEPGGGAAPTRSR